MVLMLILLSLSAFFSGTETALLSVNKVRILRLVEEGNKRAQAVQKMLDAPNRLIATILIGNNIVNIGASALATSIAIDIYGNAGVGIATGIMTLLVLVFGEVTPKNFANHNAEKWALAYGVVELIKILSVIFSPIIIILNVITNFFLKITGRQGEKDPFITEEELKLLVNVGQEEGLIAESEKEMINSIFEFDDTLVREVMVPRIDIIALDVNETAYNAVLAVVEVGHSRIPVYEGTIDNIIGVIYAKDLLKNFNNDLKNLEIKKIMRPAYYVPENKKVKNLLAELRQARVHMAIVLDEYGGTAGLITIEDVIEEIIGDIQDEYDDEEETITVLPDGSLVANARASIYDVNEILHIDLPDDEFETLGGLVFNLLGHLPKVGEELILDNVHIKVEKILGRRIDRVRVWLDKNEKGEENGSSG